MSKAIQPPITSPSVPSVVHLPRRRAALGLFGAALLAPAPAAGHPDAELLRFCAEFLSLETLVEAANSDGPSGIEDDDERAQVLAPVHARQGEILDQIVPIRATTVQGVKARAVMFATWGGDILRDWARSEYFDDRMLLALVRDVAALSDPAGVA